MSRPHPLAFFLLCTLLFSFCRPFLDNAFADDLEMINRPVSASGLTGLLFTTAPYTLAPGTLELGLSILSEYSVKPEYSINEIPLSISVGISKNEEIAVSNSYLQIKEGPSGATGTARNIGDVEVSYKWNFLPQTEFSMRPAVALLITGIVPTEKDGNTRTNTVQNWGTRIGMSIGTEAGWKEHILGLYADAQLQGQDLTDKSFADVYEIMNAGMLLPISKYRNLQMLIEYTIVQGRKFITIDGGEH